MLEESDQLELYASALDEDLENLSSDSDSEEERRRERPRVRVEQLRLRNYYAACCNMLNEVNMLNII